MNVHTLRAADLPLHPDRAVAGGTLTPTPVPSATDLVLPVPPPSNALFRNLTGRGRVKTQVYIDWEGHAGWRLRLQRPVPVPGRVMIVISIESPMAGNARRGDIDNRVKAIIDLLVKQEVIDDDKHVVALCIAWAPPASASARVMILPVAPYAIHFQPAPDGASAGWFVQAPPP